MESSEIKKQLRSAVEVSRNVFASATAFTATDAMVFVGISKDLAVTASFQTAFNNMSERIVQEQGQARFGKDDDSKLARCLKPCRLVKGGLESVGKAGGMKKAQLMRLAGGEEQDAKAGKFYMKCQRALQSLSKTTPNEPAASPPSVLDADSRSTPSQDAAASPLSMSAGNTTASALFESSSQSTTNSSQSSMIASLTGRSQTRKTSHQAGEDRANNANEQKARKFACKIATFICSLNEKRKIRSRAFNLPIKSPLR